MNLHELVSTGAPINVTINLEELRAWHQEVIEDTQRKLEKTLLENKIKRFYSPKEVGEMLDVDLSTLWRWKTRGYLIPREVGGKRKYAEEDINRILKGRE